MTRAATRFDHAVIAVDNLDSAIESYRVLGFEVSRGGRHTGRGTHNAIIRFGLEYLELIAVHDAHLAQQAGGNVGDLVAYLERTSGGPLGFALGAMDLDNVAKRWTSNYAPAGHPLAMQRIRPDGKVLTWRLLLPGGSAWRRPWPFLIEWETPSDERLADRGLGPHSNGVTGVVGLTVLTRSVHDVADLYEHDLGLEDEPDHPTFPGESFRLNNFRIHLVEPSGNALREAAFERDGDGLYEIEMRVTSVVDAAAQLGIEPDPYGRLVIPPGRACGARIVLSGSTG